MSYVYPTRSPALLGQVSRKNKRMSRRLGWYKSIGLGDDSGSSFDISQADIVGMTSSSPIFPTADTYTAPLVPPLNDIGISTPYPFGTNLLAPLGIGSPTVTPPNLANAPNLISSLASGTAKIIAGVTGAPREGSGVPTTVPSSPVKIAGLSPTALLLGVGAVVLLAVVSGGGGRR